MRKRFKVLILAFTLLILLAKPAAAFFQTAFLILQVFPQMPLKPLNWVSKPPVAQKVEFKYNLQDFEGKLVRPQDGRPHPALILSLALKSTPQDEVQIANFAESAARIGLVVLVPHSKDVQEGKLKVEDKDTFVGAFEYLSSLPYVETKKISYLGISAGSSVALVAAQDPKIAEEVHAFVFFGGYFEAKDYFSSLVTQKATYKREEFSWQPDAGAIWHVKELMINLVPQNEQPILKEILLEGKTISLPAENRLSKESQFAISVFAAKTSAELEAIWQKAPKRMLEHMRRFSPADGIENIKTKFFILHDRGDRYVHFTESRKLLDALPKSAPKTYLEVSLFEHVQPKGGFSPAILWDLTRLFLFAYQAILFLS